MGLPTIPPRLLLAIRVAQFIFGVISLSLSAASVQITRSIPRPATGDNVLLMTANGLGLLTTLYRIASYKLRERGPKSKHRLIPYATESAVVAVLLAAFIVGAVFSATGRGACFRGVQRDEDDVAQAAGSGRACTFTKVSTSFTAANFASFVASLYTLAKGMHDEVGMAKV